MPLWIWITIVCIYYTNLISISHSLRCETYKHAIHAMKANNTIPMISLNNFLYFLYLEKKKVYCLQFSWFDYRMGTYKMPNGRFIGTLLEYRCDNTMDYIQFVYGNDWEWTKKNKKKKRKNKLFECWNEIKQNHIKSNISIFTHSPESRIRCCFFFVYLKIQTHFVRLFKRFLVRVHQLLCHFFSVCIVRFFCFLRWQQFNSLHLDFVCENSSHNC